MRPALCESQVASTPMQYRAPIDLKNLTVEFDNGFTCKNLNWSVRAEQHWLICGSNGSGKSALAAILSGAGDIDSGIITGVPEQIGLVSFAAQAELIL